MRFSLWVGALFLGFATNALAASCERLLSLTFADATVTVARQVAAGAFAPEKPLALGTRQFEGLPMYSELPAFCRVALRLKPSADSDINVEIWMPTTGWNGRLAGSGNGGSAGFIRYPELGALLVQGYAVAGTDTGHEGAATDWSFALGHPENLIDLGYRSVHEMAVKAKVIVNAFYGRPARRSYWSGCSTGGRQGLTEAQRFPDDFDGIVAGAPANYMTRLNGQFLWVSQAVRADRNGFIPPAKLQLLHSAVLKACDAADGVQDGVIEDPARCHFDPKVVECTSGDAPNCLTAAQVEAARTVYEPSRNRRTKEPLYPGLEPGSEVGWGLAPVGQMLVEPSSLALGFFRYVVFADPKWDYRTFDFDRDTLIADERGSAVNAIDPHLNGFFSRGGKLLQYHGWADGQLSPLNSIASYKRVANERSNPSNMDAFYRLFMIPGMDHCRGGDGTDRFDMMSAVVEWVERGKAPAQIIAARVRDGHVDRTHPLCPYPQVAAYKGTGNVDDAVNFVCRAGKQR